MTTTRLNALDEAVERTSARLDEADVAAPDALFLMATGVDLFAENLRDPRTIELGELGGFHHVPAPWNGETLVHGRLGELEVWLLDDVSAEPVPESVPWHAGFPIWLAAAGGAGVCVHTSAGSALPCGNADSTTVSIGGFAVVRDHINLSGDSPLRGLGESRLGPLFPDQAHVHHLGLRRAALDCAEELGLRACEAIAACTAGPSLETEAERRMLAAMGAEVSVQGLGAPLITAAHAGVAMLSIVAVTDAGEGAGDVARLVDHAARAQPALEDLLVGIGEDLQRAVDARREEAGS